MSRTIRKSTDFANGVLNAVSAHIAVVDRTGEIIAVNEAWTLFARRNGNLASAKIGVGANYLAACSRAEDRGDTAAHGIRLGIESVLLGAEHSFSCEYPCHSPQEERWFTMKVSRMPETGDAVISHEDITARRVAENRLRASHDELERRVGERTLELQQRNRQLHEEIAERERRQQQLSRAAKVFDGAVEAIMITDAERNIVTVNAAFSRVTGYAPSEVTGMNPRLLSSGRHGQAFYSALWQSLDESGQWQGEIWNRRKNGEIFPAWESISVHKDANGRIIDYISLFSDISVVKNAEERLAYLAHHEPLTGLANRLLFSARLEQAIERARRHHAMVAILFIDMDNFKYINDSLGHPAGDLYLKTIAERLVALVRAEDTVARLGGDEFAIVAEDLAKAQDAGGLADKVIHQLAQGVQIGNREVASSASIGISIYPADATSSDMLLKAADSAMYQAKQEGRNTTRFYKPEMSARAFKRMALESSLRYALGSNQLRLHYQPLVDLTTMRCIGLEALLRWQSPDHGLVMPESFIALAEETRLIQPIGQWVIQRALQDLTAWRTQGVSPFRMSVNVSWKQFDDASFVDQLGRTLEDLELDGGNIELDLEITESALQSSARAVSDLFELRRRGVRVMVDDFGTGYSSLSQLIKMPVDGLKIDRTFLHNISNDRQSRAIIRAIIALGRGLDLDLVGEGVETTPQLEFLRAAGCQFAQGFLLGKPVPAEQVPDLVETKWITDGPVAPN